MENRLGLTIQVGHNARSKVQGCLLRTVGYKKYALRIYYVGTIRERREVLEKAKVDITTTEVDKVRLVRA